MHPANLSWRVLRATSMTEWRTVEDIMIHGQWPSEDVPHYRGVIEMILERLEAAYLVEARWRETEDRAVRVWRRTGRL